MAITGQGSMMGVNYHLNITVQKKNLVKGFAKLASLHDGDDTSLYDWSVDLDRDDPSPELPDDFSPLTLESFIDYLLHINAVPQGEPTDWAKAGVSVVFSFKHKLGNEVRTISLSAQGDFQYRYASSAQLALFHLYTYDYGYRDRLFRMLFDKELRPATFKILRDLNVAFGAISSDNEWYEGSNYNEQCNSISFSSGRYVLFDDIVLGTRLIEHIGLEEVCTIKPFVSWQLEGEGGPIMVFLSPQHFCKNDYYYDCKELHPHCRRGFNPLGQIYTPQKPMCNCEKIYYMNITQFPKSAMWSDDFVHQHIREYKVGPYKPYVPWSQGLNCDNLEEFRKAMRIHEKILQSAGITGDIPLAAFLD